MAKTDEALRILRLLGIPRGQQNERSALTLLAVLNVKVDTLWKDAAERPIIIHDIMGFIKTNYGVTYAENSRETIRRQTLHQFEHAGIVIRNRDDLKRATNSPKTDYIITPEALSIIRSFGAPDFNDKLIHFIENHGTLVDKYSSRKHQHDLKVEFKNEILQLSAGKHNELQIAILSDFYPRFIPEAELLYFGDAAHKMLKMNKTIIDELQFPITQHDKLPDIVFYDRTRDLLFLIEAVTSHGPMSPKRHEELNEVLADCDVAKIYISVFPTKKEMKKYIDDIAWETEVWIHEDPGHMIHFNGPKFLFVIDEENQL